MKALIVAAGNSSRLFPLTADLPKPLLNASSDGLTLIERSIGLLNDMGIDDVWVVVGFLQEKIRAVLKDRVSYVVNPFYKQTNNMTSLWLAMPHLGHDEFIYMHGDLVYDPRLLARLTTERADAGMYLEVDFDSVDEEAMKVRVEDGRFVESSKEIPLDAAAGEWTGLARITPDAGATLYTTIERSLAEEHFQDYDTFAMNRLVKQGVEFCLIPTDGLPWCEIDTAADLEHARSMFGAI